MTLTGKDLSHFATLRARTKQARDKARTLSRNLSDIQAKSRLASIASTLETELAKIDLLMSHYGKKDNTDGR